MTYRLFVGIRPPTAIREALLALQGGIVAARWQDDDQLHLTLRFAGEIEAEQADDLDEALARIHFPAFPLALRGMGHFEKKGIPHTLWAGVTPSQPLIALQRKIERACIDAGLEPERRKFAPHVTLARLNIASGSIAGFLGDHSRFQGASWMVDAFALIESHLTHPGSEYNTLRSYLLGPPETAPLQLAEGLENHDIETS